MSGKQEKRKRRAEEAARQSAGAASQGAGTPSLSGHDAHIAGLLGTSLSVAVPLQIFEFYEHGGPTVVEVEEARAFGRVLAEQGDNLLFRSKKQGETADLFSGLASALAVLAFQPDGVPPLFGGHRFDAVEILSWSIGEEAARQYCREVTERYYADLPQVSATFILAGSEKTTLTCNVTWWFHLAPEKDLLRLRTEGYSNLGHDGTELGSECIAAQVVEQVAEKSEEVAALRERAEQEGRRLICSIEASDAEYWLFVHRRRLLFQAPQAGKTTANQRSTPALEEDSVE